MMLPLFQNKKIWFPRELEDTTDMRELMEQIKYATYSGFGTKCDDGADLISQLGMLDIIYPMKSMYDEDDSIPEEYRYSAASDNGNRGPKRSAGSYYKSQSRDDRDDNMYSLYN